MYLESTYLRVLCFNLVSVLAVVAFGVAGRLRVAAVAAFFLALKRSDYRQWGRQMMQHYLPGLATYSSSDSASAGRLPLPRDFLTLVARLSACSSSLCIF
jgi:hypothetical protein